MNNKITKIVIIIVIISLLIILSSKLLPKILSVKEINKISKNNQEELFENFDSFINTNPKSDRLSYEDFKDGFWYQKKNSNNEDVFFFDTKQMINSGNTQQEILNQIEKLLSNAIIIKKEKITPLKNSDLPEFMAFYNKLLIIDTGEIAKLKKQLIKKQKKTFSDYYNLAQIYSIESKYTEALRLSKEACKIEPKNEYCKKIKIKIFNKNGKQIDELEVYRLQKNKYNFTVFSEIKKDYILSDKILQK